MHSHLLHATFDEPFFFEPTKVDIHHNSLDFLTLEFRHLVSYLEGSLPFVVAQHIEPLVTVAYHLALSPNRDNREYHQEEKQGHNNDTQELQNFQE